MEHKSLQEVQKELQSIIAARKQEEDNLNNIQTKLTSLQDSAEVSLEKLSSFKDQETSLQYKVFLMQKEALKNSLNVSGLKKIFSDNNPFVKKIKDKSKEIKEALDGTAFDKQWIDEQYEKYKEASIKKGEDIKSKDEFKNIVMVINGIKSEGNAQITAIAEKAGSELKKFSKLIQDSIKSNVSVDSKEEEKFDPPTTKAEGLDLWLKHSGSTYNEENLSELYEKYVAYLNKEFKEKIKEELIYSYQGGSFKKAFKKAFQL